MKNETLTRDSNIAGIDLIEASKDGTIEIVKELLENGADINAKDQDNETALL